jgi:uncharacterized protein
MTRRAAIWENVNGEQEPGHTGVRSTPASSSPATWHHGPMDATTPTTDDALAAVAALLRDAGGRFAFLHGSRVTGGSRPDSDVDVAVWFGGPGDDLTLRSHLPPGVDLLVLDDAPLELAGRVALHGRLLFECDPAERIAWQATTRKVHLDEQPRIERARADFAAAHRDG